MCGKRNKGEFYIKAHRELRGCRMRDENRGTINPCGVQEKTESDSS